MLDARVIKRRRDFTVDVSLQLAAGASIGLFGASGAGKSTVLSCLAGIEGPDDGHVRFDDARLYPPSLPLYRRSVGYLTQEAYLFPHLTVAQNIWFGLDVRAESAGAKAERERWIDDLRQRLGLAALWEAPASRISGGQARRVALARMLARRPPLVLLDEPFAGLDRRVVRELLDDLLVWKQSLGFSMIVVDHQAQILQRLCPRAVVIEDGQVVQTGSWLELESAPATRLLRQLLDPL